MHFIEVFAECTVRDEKIALMATRAFIKGNAVESAIGKHGSGAKKQAI